ncbi:MAG: YesL family protein, partial [Treponema sp.]|nr:YesL family protein [Treponema sp.]
MAFSPDSKFVKFMSKLVDLFFLNLVMLLCCIPVITAGASVTAAYAVILKMVDDEEGYIFKTFFKEF